MKRFFSFVLLAFFVLGAAGCAEREQAVTNDFVILEATEKSTLLITDIGSHIDGNRSGDDGFNTNKIEKLLFGHPTVFENGITDERKHGVTAAKGECANLQKGKEQL